MKTSLKVISTSPRKNTQSSSSGLSGTTIFACQILNKIQMPLLKIEHLLHVFSRYGNSQGLHKAYANYAVIIGHKAHINSKRENKLCKAAVRLS